MKVIGDIRETNIRARKRCEGTPYLGRRADISVIPVFQGLSVTTEPSHMSIVYNGLSSASRRAYKEYRPFANPLKNDYVSKTYSDIRIEE